MLCALSNIQRTSLLCNSVRRISAIDSHLRTPISSSIHIRIMSTADSHKDGSTKWASEDGQFKRQQSSFRDEIKKGGKFEPEIGRYHLIVAYACPWAHRALITRQLKGLDKVQGLLPFSAVDSLLGPEGWTFPPYDEGELKGLGVPGTGNTVEGAEDKKRIREFYLEADPDYKARCTVPIIWDKKLRTVVNNESSEIIRILNNCFDEFLPTDQQGKTYYPESKRKEIDELNAWVYDTVNNGVYKSGFATTQAAYESNVKPLFKSLDRLEDLLKDGRKFILGSEMTEADIRLYTTMIRFDPVYVGHFKCNHATIREGYPKLNNWMKNLYWNYPAFKDTTHFDSIKAHYYQSHPQINPTRIIPDGPQPNILPL